MPNTFRAAAVRLIAVLPGLLLLAGAGIGVPAASAAEEPPATKPGTRRKTGGLH